MANSLIGSKKNSVNVLSSSAVETLNGTTAVYSATQSNQLGGGRLYVAQFDLVTTNGSATVTPKLSGSLDGTVWVVVASLVASDLSTAATLASGTASSVIGIFDLREHEKIPYWRIGAVGDGATSATFKSHIILPQ